MRKYALALIALALLVTIAACSDLSEPVQQKAGGDKAGEKGEQRDAVQAVDPPKNVEKGVVPDVINVQAEAAVKAVEKAGFEADPKALALSFKESRINESDVICETDPPAGESPPEKSTVTLTYDIGC